MRQALRRNPSRAQVAVTRSIPAPVGGWNTEAPLAAMPAKDAVILDNWIPRAGYVEFRRGFIQQVSGTPAPVEAMIAWRGDPQGDKLFACAGNEIYDATDAGALGSALYSVSASTTSARWKHTNFANDAGAFAICANGVNTPIRYDGSAFATLTVTGTGLTATTLSDVMVHKRRLFWLQGDSLTVWFTDVNAIQGAAGKLPLGGYFYKGGHLVAQATWTLDGGQGIDDYAVFITSEGQVAIFSGIDPADATNWSLVGIYDLARPVGDRPLIKYGADLVVLTYDGVVPLSQALRSTRSRSDQRALTAKVSDAFAKAADQYGANYGWSGTLYSGRGALAIFNIPTDELANAEQYVQSIQTGAWCRFKGIPAICWELANEKIYFGGVEGVYRWDVGASDDSEPIVGDIKPAFSDFGNSLIRKHFTMVKAILKAPAIVSPTLEVLTDYQERVPTATPTFIEAGDISPDDADDIRDDWTGATGIGAVATPRLRVVLVGDEDTDVIAINAAMSDVLEIEEGSGDHLLTYPSLPLDVEIQCIGFGVAFQAGGVLGGGG